MLLLSDCSTLEMHETESNGLELKWLLDRCRDRIRELDAVEVEVTDEASENNELRE